MSPSTKSFRVLRHPLFERPPRADAGPVAPSTSKLPQGTTKVRNLDARNIGNSRFAAPALQENKLGKEYYWARNSSLLKSARSAATV
ncbi:hypothetical protein Y032_0426g1262 [Ancylostoma ceylanicum]|uniref:Uncharacterized protein n=1 Tax=Ancylostoma ceylanicum TaxID=53326 RepID=A0A016X0Q0_9BILA|nr:hypothetical protein Y032_0426g1262 [Ancylostoma ceylanicum]